MHIKKSIYLKLIFLLLNVLMASHAFAMTVNWDNVCDIFWNSYIADLTQNQMVSALDLQDNSVDLEVTAPVWCYTPSNVTSGDAQHIGMAVTSQSTNISPVLGLTYQTPSKETADIPFKLCMGDKSQQLLCVKSVGDKMTYNWGTNPQDPSLLPIMFHPLGPSDPTDPCKSNNSCHRWLSPSGPYKYIAHIHAILESDGNHVVPGRYQDIVSLKFNGQVASGLSIYPDLDITANNAPTFTVVATISPTCQIQDAPNVNFSGYLSSKMTAEQDLKVRCTYTTPYQISFKGSHDDNGWFVMQNDQNANQKIRYQMYADNHYTQPWNTSTASLRKGSGSTETIPIYYRTDPTQANQIAGKYEDSVIVTVAY